MDDHSFDGVWFDTLDKIRLLGNPVTPRGLRTLELEHHTVQVDMLRPVLMCPDRKLNYRFAAAEAWWILSGLDSLYDLTPWNPNMAKFSDDGLRLSGAYGPRVARQLSYVVGKLISDPDTRQATMTTW